jgi:formylglycine-generating enzyme required for sulfatase activity
MIDKYEVTNTFYCQFLNSGGNDAYWNADQQIGRTGSPGSYYYAVAAGRENHPAVSVNKADAEAFAGWRSQVEGATYRLPTEEEWEKAAAWDPVQRNHYTYGFQNNTIDSTWSNYNFSIGTTTPVGYFDGTPPRNDAKSYYGCYDMSGNVWEWTWSGALAGGGWSTSTGGCTSFSRDVNSPSARYDNSGFRLVLSSP